jgi:hypothetical protein
MASRRFRSILDGADPTGAHLRVPEDWVVDSNSGRPTRRPGTARCAVNLGARVRRANSRAMSVRVWTSSFFKMWETWIATVRRDSTSLTAISGLDSPSATKAAILISVGVRLSQPLRACRCLARGPRRMPRARNAASSRAASAAAPRET